MNQNATAVPAAKTEKKKKAATKAVAPSAPDVTVLSRLDTKAMRAADSLSLYFERDGESLKALLTLTKKVEGFQHGKSDPWEATAPVEKVRQIELDCEVLTQQRKPIEDNVSGSLLVTAPGIDLFASQAIKGARTNRPTRIEVVLDACSAGHAAFLVMEYPKRSVRFLLGFPSETEAGS